MSVSGWVIIASRNFLVYSRMRKKDIAFVSHRGNTISFYGVVVYVLLTWIFCLFSQHRQCVADGSLYPGCWNLGMEREGHVQQSGSIHKHRIGSGIHIDLCWNGDVHHRFHWLRWRIAWKYVSLGIGMGDNSLLFQHGYHYLLLSIFFQYAVFLSLLLLLELGAGMLTIVLKDKGWVNT